MVKRIGSLFHPFDFFHRVAKQMECSPLVLFGIFIVGFFCFISHILTPFTGDIRVFFSSAFLADQMNNFPCNIDASWEIKPWGNRAIIYLLYKVGIQLFDFTDKIGFEIGIKVIFGIIMITSVIGLLFSLKSRIKGHSLHLIYIGLLLFFSLFSVSYFCVLQPEYFSIVIVLISLALLFVDSREANVLSGFLVGLLLVIKGITVIFALQFILVALIIEGDLTKRVIISLGGFFIGTFISLASFAVFPNALSDLYYATLFQSSLENFNVITRSLLTVFYIHKAFTHIPVLLPGLFAGAATIPFFIWTKKWKKLALFVLLWLTAFAPVIIQGKYFPYHYLSFIIPAIFSIILLLCIFKDYSDTLDRNEKLSIGWVLFLPTLLTTLILCSIWLSSDTMPASAPLVFITFCLIFFGLAAMYRKKPRVWAFHTIFLSLIIIFVVFNSACGYHYITYSNRSAQITQANMQLKDEFSLNQEEVILYLDAGVAPYFFESRSFCRYFYPLPLQRANSNPKLKETPLYSDTLKHILSYNGRIIILDPNWFCLESQDNLIAEKIRSEYTVLYDQSIENYSGYVIFLRKDLL